MQYEIGECVTTKVEGVGLRIDRADPQIMVAVEVLGSVRSGDFGPGVSLDGDLLRIEGINRCVVYRIGELTPSGSAHFAAWPD